MDREDLNENLFKNMAMTFSLEGTTGDIQDIIQKKINYNIRALKELSSIIGSLASSKDKSFKNSILKDAQISEFIKEVFCEYKVISGCTNLILQELMQRKDFLNKKLITKNL